jgi:hypothetical protein
MPDRPGWRLNIGAAQPYKVPYQEGGQPVARLTYASMPPEHKPLEPPWGTPMSFRQARTIPTRRTFLKNAARVAAVAEADGLILSRKCSEKQMANLSAAGRAVPAAATG